MTELIPDKPEVAPSPLGFPVVGVGASAGGLEAFETFLRGLDPSVDAAYILVQHLDPNHESMLAELLERHTHLGVRQITDGTEVRPREVYIIPSASGLQIEDGVLNLVEFDAPRGFRRPIDDFFQSLALDQADNAAAIVLSGTGGDGTVGIRHVKEAGGLTLVQEPGEAAYDGMPSSAIGTGLVDHVLPVAGMGSTIARYFAARKAQPSQAAFDREDFIASVMAAVRGQTGHDFSYYKVNTVLRRIQRRMQVLDLIRPSDYVDALRADPSEGEALFQDLLINVTSFFRDPEVWDLVRRDVIPPILRAAGPDRPVRVWVPGCSSGEEAYSIAILIAEGAARLKVKPEIQVFATDIDEEMLQRARRATYMQSSVADMPPELLGRYFTATEEGYSVIPSIRDMVRVSSHSVIKDPPFSRLDLVSCRNLLIYFDARLQSRILPLFHYALRPDGWMVLGSAENLAGRDDLFRTESREARVYRKNPKATSNFVLPIDTRQRDGDQRTTRISASQRREGQDERLDRVAQRAMERYVLPHVVVDPQGDVLHVSGRTAPFLQFTLPQTGGGRVRLLDLAPSELRPALRSVLAALAERRRKVIRRGIEVPVGDEDILTVDLVADPLDAAETMIVFRETGRRQADDDDADADVGDFRVEERIQQLEDELRETQATLRSTVEELETSNEELKSSNEEMMSMNEELQSANEELSTVNEELKSKLDELARLNADQQNLLESTRIATVFVDPDMRVRSFTPMARKLFRFVERDKGRPLLDVRTTVAPELLRDAVAAALDGKTDERREIAVGDETYTFRALPYLDHDGNVDGAVLVFDDVSALVRSQETALGLEKSVAAGRREIERLYESAPIGMALLDREHRYRRINRSLAAYNGLAQDSHLGQTVTEVLPAIGPRMADVLDGVFETGEGLSRWELRAPAPQDPEGEDEIFEIDIYPLAGDDGAVERVGLIVHRVTEARRMEGELRHLMGELQHRVKNSLATVMGIVRQTARTAPNREALASALSSRIGALAATHSLLTAADWGTVSLRQIAEQELEPYAADGRISFEGPALGLAAKAAVGLTLVLHEMVTNSAKHGALSRPDGRLDVTWAAEGHRFRLDWREAIPDGAEAPERTGFGLRFVERTVEHDLGGTIHYDWGEDGMHARIDGSLEKIREGQPDG